MQQPVDTVLGLMQNLNQRMVDNGGQTGDLNVALIWSDVSDLDLHVVCPCGTHIYFGNRSCSKCKANLDVDMNRVEDELSQTPIENISWVNPPAGRYHIYVHNYKSRLGDNICSPFKCIISTKNESKVFIDVIKHKENKTIYLGDLFAPIAPPILEQVDTGFSEYQQVVSESQQAASEPSEWIPQARYDLTQSSRYDPSMPPSVSVFHGGMYD